MVCIINVLPLFFFKNSGTSHSNFSSADIEDDELWETFQNCGEIESVRIIRDNAIGMSKGFGYVNFKSQAAVELALKLNNHEIKKRKINVARCKKEVKKKKNKKNAKTRKNKMEIKTADSNIKPLGLNNQNSKVKPVVKQNVDFQGKVAEKKKKKVGSIIICMFVSISFVMS